MKYIIGSLIISFGILLVAVMLLISLNVKAPEDGVKYFMLAWGVMAIFSYPIAKKIVRDE